MLITIFVIYPYMKTYIKHFLKAKIFIKKDKYNFFKEWKNKLSYNQK